MLREPADGGPGISPRSYPDLLARPARLRFHGAASFPRSRACRKAERPRCRSRSAPMRGSSPALERKRGSAAVPGRGARDWLLSCRPAACRSRAAHGPLYGGSARSRPLPMAISLFTQRPEALELLRRARADGAPRRALLTQGQGLQPCLPSNGAMHIPTEGLCRCEAVEYGQEHRLHLGAAADAGHDARTAALASRKPVAPSCLMPCPFSIGGRGRSPAGSGFPGSAAARECGNRPWKAFRAACCNHRCCRQRRDAVRARRSFRAGSVASCVSATAKSAVGGFARRSNLPLPIPLPVENTLPVDSARRSAARCSSGRGRGVLCHALIVRCMPMRGLIVYFHVGRRP